MTTSGEHELHTLAGPYVMDAVTPDEAGRFASHLAECAPCRQDVREMREATARLGMAAAVRPRPELKAQTIRAAFMTSQLAPVIAGAGEIRPGHRERRRAWRLPRLAGGIRSAGTPARIAAVAAVFAIAAAMSFGLLTRNMMQQLHHSQRQDHIIADVLNARDAVMLTAKISTGGTATVVMSHAERRLVFTAHGLRRLPGSQAYELWLMGPAGDRPAGMLTRAPDGTAGPAVVSGIRPGDVLGMTVEPVTGAALPTSAVVVVIRQHR